MTSYNPYYPNYPTYQQNYPAYQQVYQQPNISPVQQTNQQTKPNIQDGGFVSVPSIEEARNYHVGLGMSVTFKDENAPYIYTKTRGFSQLEKPIFEVYRLVKEEDIPQEPQDARQGTFDGATGENADYALKSDIEALRSVYNDLKGKVDELLSQSGGDHE